jgi:predicted RNA-binding Zn ribbon-like protein
MAGTAPADAAPGRLAVVQDLVNSFDVVRGRDALAEPEVASAWLSSRGLLGRDALLTSGDLGVLHELRSAIRGLCLANRGREAHPQDARLLSSIARAAGVHPEFVHERQAELAVNAAGGLGACGRLVAIVFEAVWDGTWPRLKACPGDACNSAAYYDQTRNNSRMWCSMARCGSRAKMRAYRARQQHGNTR